MCILKSFKCRKACYKMIFRPEHAEDSSVYVKSNIWVCFWIICERNIKNDRTPTYIIICVCLLLVPVEGLYPNVVQNLSCTSALLPPINLAILTLFTTSATQSIWLYLPVLLIKRLRIGVFLLIEIKIKTASCIAVFGCTTGNILNIFWSNMKH